MSRLTLAAAMTLAAQIESSSIDSFQKEQQLSSINYYSRGKGRKSPRTFSGVARARREAKKLHNKAKHS